MADEFLATQLLPGTPPQQHVHRRLTIALVVAIVVAIIICVALYFAGSRSEQQPVAAPVVQTHSNLSPAMIAQLQNAPQPTPVQVTSVLNQLSSQKATVTTVNTAAALKRLSTQIGER